MKFRSGLETLPSYGIEETAWKIKLDANERTDGLPPAVAQRISERFAALPFNRYPEITACTLRTRLAGQLGCAAEQIQVGNGSSELLAAICQVFGGPGRKMIYPEPSFSMYPVYIQLADSQPVPFRLTADYWLDLTAFIEQARQADLAIICNPNNPTGNVLPPASIAILARELTCPLVVDEAYFEFYQISAADLLQETDNLIIVRTFSKAYGLAAARAGYLAASAAVSAAIGKVLLPYHLNALSLTAATTVLEYQDEFLPGIDRIIRERRRLAARLAELPGLTVYPSETNFLLIKMEQAVQAAARLAAAGIGIRDFSRSPGLTDCLRISIGSPAENDAVFHVLETICRDSVVE